MKFKWPPMNADKPLMADGPATLNDENVPDSLVEELTSCGAFSEQRR
jgi:hypothetical protein